MQETNIVRGTVHENVEGQHQGRQQMTPVLPLAPLGFSMQRPRCNSSSTSRRRYADRIDEGLEREASKLRLVGNSHLHVEAQEQ